MINVVMVVIGWIVAVVGGLYMSSGDEVQHEVGGAITMVIGIAIAILGVVLQ